MYKLQIVFDKNENEICCASKFIKHLKKVQRKDKSNLSNASDTYISMLA